MRSGAPVFGGCFMQRSTKSCWDGHPDQQDLRRLYRDDGDINERSGLNHRDNPAGRVEMAPDSRLADLDAALPGIVYAHGERGRKCASAIPVQRTGACRAHTHRAKG
jgi:hypothetical protein